VAHGFSSSNSSAQTHGAFGDLSANTSASAQPLPEAAEEKVIVSASSLPEAAEEKGSLPQDDAEEPVNPMIFLKQGAKIRIKPSLAMYAGRSAYIEGTEDDKIVVKLVEGPETAPVAGKLISLSPLHIETGDGRSLYDQPLMSQPDQPLMVAGHAVSPLIPGLKRGDRVRCGGELCPQKFCGKIGFVDTPDVGDGTGCARIRIEAPYSVHEGFITSGGTFMKEVMTVEQAKATCALMGGLGFTHSGGVTPGPVSIFIKNKWDLGGRGWTSYRLEEDPDGCPRLATLAHRHLTMC